MERGGRGHLFDPVEVAMQSVTLVRKGAGEGFDKGFAPVGKGKVFSFEPHHIVGRWVEAAQRQAIDAEKAQQAVERLPRVGAPDEVHPRFELCSFPYKALQATSGLRALLQDGDGPAVARQHNGGGEAAQPTTNDDASLHSAQCIGGEWTWRWPAVSRPTGLGRSGGAHPLRW